MPKPTEGLTPADSARNLGTKWGHAPELESLPPLIISPEDMARLGILDQPDKPAWNDQEKGPGQPWKKTRIGSSSAVNPPTEMDQKLMRQEIAEVGLFLATLSISKAPLAEKYQKLANYLVLFRQLASQNFDRYSKEMALAQVADLKGALASLQADYRATPAYREWARFFKNNKKSIMVQLDEMKKLQAPVGVEINQPFLSNLYSIFSHRRLLHRCDRFLRELTVMENQLPTAVIIAPLAPELEKDLLVINSSEIATVRRHLLQQQAALQKLDTQIFATRGSRSLNRKSGDNSSAK